MDHDRLITTVADDRLARVLGSLVGTFEAAFGRHNLAYYLIGSWVDGMTNDLSDVDVIVVWTRGRPCDVDLELGQRLLHSLRHDTRLDVALFGEQEVAASRVGVNLKLASLLLHGPDIRDRLLLPPLDVYRADTVKAALCFMSRVLRGVDEVPVPVDYPQPDGTFFGYDRKRVDAWYPAAVTQGLKEWVSTATRIARALVALQGGRYVGSKSEAIVCYGTNIGDEWSDYLAMLYQKGKGEWAYRVPEDIRERDALRRLCARFVEFERHFLDVIDGYPGIVSGEGI